MEMRISNNLLCVNSTNLLSAHLAVNKIILKDNNKIRRAGFKSKWEERKKESRGKRGREERRKKEMWGKGERE